MYSAAAVVVAYLMLLLLYDCSVYVPQLNVSVDLRKRGSRGRERGGYDDDTVGTKIPLLLLAKNAPGIRTRVGIKFRAFLSLSRVHRPRGDKGKRESDTDRHQCQRPQT